MTRSKRYHSLLRLAVGVVATIIFLTSYFMGLMGLYGKTFAAAGIGPDVSFNYVKFLDIGQGDAALLHSNGKFMLIDSGNSLDDGNRIAHKLMSLGVKRLEYLICSHPHNDHIGGVCRIFDEIKVGGVFINSVDSDYSGDSVAVGMLESSAAKYGVDIKSLSKGNSITLGDYNVNAVWFANRADQNDNSLVLIAECDGKRFFFGGDISSSVERSMIDSGTDLSCFVLKASHHGSGGSTSDLFLDVAQPEYCVVSCAKNNKYGFPTDAFKSRVKSHGVILYTTADNGDVTFDTTRKRVFTEK